MFSKDVDVLKSFQKTYFGRIILGMPFLSFISNYCFTPWDKHPKHQIYVSFCGISNVIDNILMLCQW